MTSWPAFVVLGLALALGCSKDPSKLGEGAAGKAAGSAAPAAPASGAHGLHQRDGKDGLKAWIEMSRDACATKDFARGKSLVLSAIPTKADLQAVFQPTVGPDKLESVLEIYSHLPPSDEQAACLFSARPERTVISIYSATVEQLQAYEDGTDAYREFPGGAKDLADSWLRPGKTFYEVEMTEPGKPDGTKYHLFFWDGNGWKMLGPVWRALPGGQ